MLEIEPLIKKLFKKKTEPLAIDIGYNSVKVAKLGKGASPGEYRLEFAGQLMVPMTDPNFVPTLHEYLGKNGLLGLPTATCFDDAKLKIRKIELAKMPEADLLEAIRWKMRDLVEGNVDNFVVRYSLLQEVGTAEAKRLILVGFLAPRETIKETQNNLLKIGLKPTAIEPTAVAMAFCTDKIYSTEKKWVGAIDLGLSKSIMVIMGQGKFHFSRPLTGIVVKDIVAVDPTFNQRLAAEIQHTIDNFSIAFHVEQLDRIYLSGGGAGIEGLAEYLTKNLAIETFVINPFQAIFPEEQLAEKSPEHPYLYTQAISLAMT